MELNELGYLILHIREFGLPSLDKFYGSVIEVLPNENDLDYINITLYYLSTLVDEPRKSMLKSFIVNKQLYDQELKFIYSFRYPDVVEPNLSMMCGIEYWDKNLNYPLDPTHVQKLEWVPAILTCENNRKIPLPRYHRNYRPDCKELDIRCNKCCYGIICPLLCYCKKTDNNKVHCNYVEDKIRKMIDNGESFESRSALVTLKRWLIEESDLGERIINEYLHYPVESKKRKKIASFLGCNSKEDLELINRNEFDIYSAF